MKKGFTLVELLATIALISLILGLIFQIFTRQLEVSKENVYERQITTLKQIAKDYHLKNTSETYVKIDDLLANGLIDNEEIIDPRDGSNITGCIKFILDDKYNQYDYIYESNIENCN